MLKVSVRQIKAARMLLDWSQDRLAEEANVGIATIKRLEAQDNGLGGRDDTVGKIVGALEAAGVEFTNGGGAGVRLRKAGEDDLPSVRMYFAARLTSKERAWVHEWSGAAEDNQSAVQKIATHLKHQIDGAPGYMLSDAVSLKALDQSIVKEGTVADFLSTITGRAQ
jgi:transcriptional regulator with XRE-family HTH domain